MVRAVPPMLAGASLGHAGHDPALALSLVANKWTYPNGVSEVVAEDHLTVEQYADRRHQDTEQEVFRRAQLAPMYLSAY